MTPLFKKLNYKDQPEILILNAPESFADEQAAIQAHARVTHQVNGQETLTFALVFVMKQEEVDHSIKMLNSHLEGDAILWMAYPKGTSKKYKCDFNRDTGWNALGEYGFEPVRQVSIDADWSALRFRRVEYISRITRSKDMTLTKEARKRTTGK